MLHYFSKHLRHSLNNEHEQIESRRSQQQKIVNVLNGNYIFACNYNSFFLREAMWDMMQAPWAHRQRITMVGYKTDATLLVVKSNQQNSYLLAERFRFKSMRSINPDIFILSVWGTTWLTESFSSICYRFSSASPAFNMTRLLCVF